MMKRRQIVEHVPRSISRACAVHLRSHSAITCTVTGGHEYSSDLVLGGLQIPCTLCFTGDKNWLEKLALLLKSGKQPDAVDSSSSVRFKQLDKLICEPVKIKEEITVDDEACSSGSLDKDVWVKCDKSVLTCEDKKDY